MSVLAKRSAALCTALLAGVALPAQWSFQLDTTFRTQILQQNVNSLGLLPSGDLLLSGIMRFQNEASDRFLAKVDASGNRDLNFPFAPGSGRLTPWNNAFYVSLGQVVQRILPSTGWYDPAFIGLNDGPYFQSFTGGDYHVFPDGRVLMSGSHLLSDSIRGYEGYYELIWFTNTGYLDTTRTHRNANGPIYAFKELPDGKFICFCNCSQYEGQPVSKLFRVEADGALDPTFQPGMNWGNVFAYHGLPDGRVYVGGRYKRAAAPNDTLYLARFLPDGSLDPAFTPPQINSSGLPNPASGAFVGVIQPWEGDHLILGGRFRYVNGSLRQSICLLDNSGQLNDAFDSCGVGTFQFWNVTYSSVAQVLLDSANSSLYICGAYTDYFDDLVNDTLQRFVSRLLVHELSTAIHEQIAPNVRVYPNPATGRCTVEVEQLRDHSELRVRDTLGREILRQAVRNYSTTLNLHTLPDGCYTLEVRDGVGRVAHQQLVVQH